MIQFIKSSGTFMLQNVIFSVFQLELETSKNKSRWYSWAYLSSGEMKWAWLRVELREFFFLLFKVSFVSKVSGVVMPWRAKVIKKLLVCNTKMLVAKPMTAFQFKLTLKIIFNEEESFFSQRIISEYEI